MAPTIYVRWWWMHSFKSTQEKTILHLSLLSSIFNDGDSLMLCLLCTIWLQSKACNDTDDQVITMLPGCSLQPYNNNREPTTFAPEQKFLSFAHWGFLKCTFKNFYSSTSLLQVGGTSLFTPRIFSIDVKWCSTICTKKENCLKPFQTHRNHSNVLPVCSCDLFNWHLSK